MLWKDILNLPKSTSFSYYNSWEEKNIIVTNDLICKD